MSAPTPPSTGPRPLGVVATLIVLLTVTLWGGTPTAVKYTTDVLPSLTVSGIRFGLAAVFMLGWCAIERAGMWPRRDQWGPCLGAGFLLFLQIGLFTYAIAFSNASHATLCINTFIFWVLLIEHFYTRDDRLTPIKLAGVGIAVCGVLTIVLADEQDYGTDSNSPSRFGDALMLVSAVVLAIKVVYTKWATTRVEPGKLILWHDIIGTGWFLVAAAIFEWPEVAAAGWRVYFDPPVALGLLYQGVVVGGFCFAAQTALLERYSASQITVFSFLTPVCGVTIAVLFRGDVLSRSLYLGAACVATGILTVTLSNLRARAVETPP